MAVMLKMTAGEAVNKGQPSTFYPPDKNNPVLQAMDQEIKLYVAYMKKRTTRGYKPPNDEPASRPADTLFQLWNKYEPRLPKLLYQSKLLEMGDFLVSIKEYSLALWQCYGRYLKSFGDVNVEEITNVKDFKEAFFPAGFNAEDAGFTFRALMGKCISSYQVTQQTDPKLQNSESIVRCLSILRFLRLVTQVILPTEALYWLVYNGTIHIYSISRHLMMLGHSAMVIEFLLWSCMCMESSIPLLGVKYLTWRATLYTAVCQCYYDCNQGHHAEAFARRSLSKINELSQLESMSNSSESQETVLIFRQSTVKMAAMVFKRTVYETRRKPKGLLRPKTRANLKDAAQLPWPRTASEKLLADMFEGSSAQMLAILEALSSSNKRSLLSSPPAPDAEVEILDVYAELFMAAQEIVAGGGGHLGGGPVHKLAADLPLPGLGGVVKERPLIDMATRGEDGVPLSVLVKLAKLAYSYEQWDYFDTFLEAALTAIREVNDPQYSVDEKCLELLFSYDKVVPRAKQRKLFQTTDGEDDDNQDVPSLPPPPTKEKAGASQSGEDSLIGLAEVLLSVTTGPYTQESLDMDMMVDACLTLWKKCKEVFQKFQTGSTDNPKYLQKMDNPSKIRTDLCCMLEADCGKWVYILDIVHQVLGWCGLSAVDPSLTAEVVLRLALVFEASAALDMAADKKAKSAKSMATTIRDHDHEQPSTAGSKDSPRRSEFASAQPPSSLGGPSRASIISGSMLAGQGGGREQLIQAREILELGLQNVSYARQAVALTDGKNIADIGWVKDLNREMFQPLTESEHASLTSAPPPEPSSEAGEATAVWNMVKDLHLELIFMYHRVCLKLAQIGPDPTVKTTSKAFKRKTCSSAPFSPTAPPSTSAYIESFDELVDYCQRNQLSKALLYMQKALMLPQTASNQQHKYLEDAMGLIRKAEAEEKKVYVENTVLDQQQQQEGRAPPPSKLPPAPLLLCRTDTTMVLKPAPFVPASRQKVAWYRLFCRSAAGSNVKVRLNDYYLPGCGQEVPSFRCELQVSGLSPGEKYVCAVAAYTAEGKLIGDCVGESTRPILASHPMPILMTWAYLCQVAYQVGYYSVATDAAHVLWSHFVAEPPPPQQITYVTSAQDDFKLTLHKLNLRVVGSASPVLLRMFLTSLFIGVDIRVKQGLLFCDILCDKGPLNKGQLSRLQQCEYLLIALELAGWLNESNLALQAVVQCYGLLAPVVHYKIPAVPVIQVLERCNAVLQEIPVSLRTKRTPAICDSLNHMIACLTYYMAKVLRSWNQRGLASNINDSGRKMLTAEAAAEKEKHIDDSTAAATAALTDAAHQTDTGSLTLAALKKKKSRKAKASSEEGAGGGIGNEELKALEAHMLRLSKQAQGEHELTGNEEPSILHAYIAYLPSRIAIKEVQKFRRRARYLEFFVQVAQKALSEGNAEQALEWCDETANWLHKRNEGILGSKTAIGKQPGVVTVSGDDPKKYAAALVEYSKDKPSDKPDEGKGGTGDAVPSTAAAKSSLDKLDKADKGLKTSKVFSKPDSKAGKSTDQDPGKDGKKDGKGKGGEKEGKMKGGEEKEGKGKDGKGKGGDGKEGKNALADESKDTQGSKRDGSPRGKGDKSKAAAAQQSKPKPKKLKYKPIGLTPHMTDSQKAAQEELELRAIELLQLYLVDMYQARNRRRKFRKFSVDERPWRSQLNVVQGLSQFGVFMQRLECKEKAQGTMASYLYSTSFLDPEWFEFETAGTLVVSWQSPATPHQQLPPSNKPVPKSSSIEIAAAATTGAAPPPLFAIPMEEDDDTPRTYRSEGDPPPPPKRKGGKKGPALPSDDPEAFSKDEATAVLKNTFQFFNRAVVLAHRGGHWTLLQNACRVLWNCAHTALLRAISPDPRRHGEPFMTTDALRALVWQPFYTAADLLLDMMVQLQGTEKSHSKKKKDHSDPLEDKSLVVHSIMGSSKAEKGGASLKFEHPLDDVSSIDARWLRRLVLRVLEMLHYENQWEKLVDLALRFNALSDERYAEQIMPLLVQAQRNLSTRVSSHGGPSVPQPHYKKALLHSKHIDAKTYTTQQLRVELPDDYVHQEIGPGAGIDPTGSDVYSGGLRAMQLCCVPLDVPYSLHTLRSALSKSQYTARALQHSRKLMVLYLSGQTSPANVSDIEPMTRASSRVDFERTAARPQPSMPPDLSKETYMAPDDIHTCPLPKSQVSLVINSYDKTIELLVAGNQKGLAAEAMRELGNLHYHTHNMRGAYKWWCDALDTLLGITDAVHTWRELQRGEDLTEALLDKCGLWGCVLGAILAANIAQYVLTSDLGMRTECCFLSGYLFKAVFRSSLPHPRADHDYALYEVGGDGCEVTGLLPGVDLLAERFRCDGRTLVAALRFVMEELARGRHNLFVLPLVTLSQYFTTYVCRDLQRTVDVRILKTRVLTDLGLLSEAVLTLQRLLHGERLPHSADATFRQVESRLSPARFNAGKPVLEPANIKVLETILEKRLSPSLSSLYGPHLTCMTALVQAHLLVAIADTIPVIPVFEDGPPGQSVVVQPHSISATTKAKGAKMANKAKNSTDQIIDEEEVHGSEDGKKVSVASKTELDKLKGLLLSTSDGILATMSEIIVDSNLYDKGLDVLSPSELELVVLAKVELAVIAQQRHHAVMAARLAHSAITFIQRATIFSPKSEALNVPRKTSSLRKSRARPIAAAAADLGLGAAVGAEDTHNQYENFQSRSRLDARLWLTCRLALVRAMITEIRGLGQVKGSDAPVHSSLGSVRQYCAEGVAEAEAAGEVELYAEFLLQGALLNMMDGRPIADTQHILTDVLSVLSRVAQLSPAGELLHSVCVLFLTDLQAAAENSTTDTQQKYSLVHNSLLKQLERLGEKIECRYDGHTEFSSPVSPLENLYLPQLLPLVQAKLRLGHAMARQVLQTLKDNRNSVDASVLWSKPLGVLTTALELSKVMSVRVASVEAEILLHMGKIQRQLFNLGKYQARVAASTLLQAITTSYGNDHDLGLIRQAYLELSLVYLWSSGAVVLREGSVIDTALIMDSEDESGSLTGSKEDLKAKRKKKYKDNSTDGKQADNGTAASSDSEESIVVKPTKAARKSSKLSKKTPEPTLPVQSKKEKQKEKQKSQEPMSDKDQEKRAAWIAIRCATAAGQALRARSLLVGQSAVTSQPLPAKAHDQLPEFVPLDLLHFYVLGEKKKVYKNDIEEELAPLTEALDPPPIETYHDELTKVKQAAATDLSWTHIMGYQTILQRLCSTTTLSTAAHMTSKPADEQPEFDLDAMSQYSVTAAESDNDNVVRTMMFSEAWALRLNQLHAFLTRQLATYAQDCTAIYPPKAMILPPEQGGQGAIDLEVISKSYAANSTVPLDAQPDTTSIPSTTPPGTQEPVLKPSDRAITTCAENDVCLQWLLPSLEERVTVAVEGSGERHSMLIYAVGRKKEADKYHCAMMWISQEQLRDLHERLCILTQRAEISLVDKPKKEPASSAATTASTGDKAGGKGKKQARIKALSPKIKRDEHLEALLQQCMDDAQRMLGYVPEPPEPETEGEESETQLVRGAGEDEEAVSPQPGRKKKEQPQEEQTQKSEFPFEVTKANMYRFEQLFDPGFGLCLKDKKMLDWLMICFS